MAIPVFVFDVAKGVAYGGGLPYSASMQIVEGNSCFPNFTYAWTGTQLQQESKNVKVNSIVPKNYLIPFQISC